MGYRMRWLLRRHPWIRRWMPFWLTLRGSCYQQHRLDLLRCNMTDRNELDDGVAVQLRLPAQVRSGRVHDLSHAAVSNYSKVNNEALAPPVLSVVSRQALSVAPTGCVTEGYGVSPSVVVHGCSGMQAFDPSTQIMQVQGLAPLDVSVVSGVMLSSAPSLPDHDRCVAVQSLAPPAHALSCSQFPLGHSDILPSAPLPCVLPLEAFPTLREREGLYVAHLPDKNTQHLTEMEMDAYMAMNEVIPGQFFPSLSLQRKNLSLINYYFMVGPSKVVAGQKGLFLRRRVPAHKRRLFVGLYSGWVTAEGHGSPLDVPGKNGMYSLSLGRRIQRAVHGVDRDLPDVQDTNFPLSRANEFIWDPEMNCLRFDNGGRVYLRGTAISLAAGAEVFVQLGDDYGWRHYWEILMARSLRMMVRLSMRVGAADWAGYLRLQLSHLGRGEYTSFLLYVLEHVIHYPERSDTRSALPDASFTMHDWCVSLFRHRTFGHHHIFRQADHPGRLRYDEDDLFERLVELPVEDRLRPLRFRQVKRVEYGVGCDDLFCDELVNAPGASIRYLPALLERNTFYLYRMRRACGRRGSAAAVGLGSIEYGVVDDGVVDQGDKCSHATGVPACGLESKGALPVMVEYGVADTGGVGQGDECNGIADAPAFSEVGDKAIEILSGTGSDTGWVACTESVNVAEAQIIEGVLNGAGLDGGELIDPGGGGLVTARVTGPSNGLGGSRKSCAMPMELCGDYLLLLASQPAGRRSDLNVAFHNVNTLTYDKVLLLLAGFVSHDLDVLVCVDTRIHSSADRYRYQELIKERLGVGVGIHFATTVPVYNQRTNHHTSVGGQLVIISPRVGRAAAFVADPSGCGVVTTTTLAVGAASVLVVGVYVPVTAQEGAEGALWAKVQSFLGKREGTVTPLEYVHQYIEKVVESHQQASGTYSIIGGDFNAALVAGDVHQGVHGDLWEWHISTGLQHAASTLHAPLPPTRVDKQGNGGNLDHVFVRGQVGRVTGAKVLQAETWAYSDHRPVYVSCKLEGWDKPYVRRRLRVRKAARYTWDVDRPSACVTDKQRNCLEMYRTGVRKRVGLCLVAGIDDSAGFVERLSLAAASVSKGLARRPRRSYGWSKETVALTMARSTLLSIKRHIEGSNGVRRWDDICRLERRVDVWEKWLRRLCDTDEEFEHLSTLPGRAPEYWKDKFDVTLTREYTSAVGSLTRCIRRRRRLELQELIRKRHKEMKEARQSGTHLRISKTLLSRVKPFFTLDELQDTDGKIITDQREILRRATSHFHDWHAESDMHTVGFHDVNVDRERLLSDRDYFITQHRPTGIPEGLLGVIWNALRPPDQLMVPNTRIQEDQRRMLETPSYGEFRKQLDATPSKSAPGPTGMTYNMMAALPEEHLYLLYQHLVKLWDNKNICDFWKWRLLSPLPKVDTNVTINDIRPLTLIETSRKLWVSIFVGRVNSFWERYGLLQDMQHGFTRERGIDSIHMQHRNMLEENQETCSSLYYSTWDIKRAFDRVPKHVLELSWVRLGIPPVLARYLVDFDTRGFTIIATPYSRRILGTQGRHGFSLEGETKAPCFQASVGTGQGDVGSPDNWKCFFDITLTALRRSVVSPFYVRGQFGVLMPVEDTAFADDLLSTSSTLRGLQDKADIMSAATIVFGLQMSVGKLRAVQLHWGVDCPVKTSNLHLSIHDGTWDNVQEVKLLSWDDPGPLVRYLGIGFDFNNEGGTQLRSTRLEVLRDLRSLRRRAGPVDVKLDVLFSASMMRAGFAAKYSSWTLGQLQEIDKFYDRECRRLLRMMPTMPTALLHSRVVEPGMQLPRFSDRVHLDKLSLFFRGLESQNSTRHAVHGLANRSLRLQGINPVPGCVYSLDKVSAKPLWVNSLVEWLQLASLRLTTGGRPPPVMLQSVQAYVRGRGFEVSAELEELLVTHGLYQVQDIYEDKTDGVGTLLGLPWLGVLGLPRRLELNGEVVRLSALQVWSFPPYVVAVEVLGWAGETEIHVRRWLLPVVTHRSERLRGLGGLKVGCLLHLDLDTPSYGAGSPVVEQASFFMQRGGLLVVLGPDQFYRGVVRREVVYLRGVIGSRRVMPSWELPALELPRSMAVLQEWLDGGAEAYHIFTDASVKAKGSPIDRYFYPRELGTLGASIVIQPREVKGLSTDTIIIRITDLDTLARPTIYMLETLAAITAAMLRHLLVWRDRPRIYLDCKGVVSTIRKLPKRPWKRPTFQLLNALRLVDGGDIFWTRSHPERRGHKSTWSYVAHGNHLADRAASMAGVKLTGRHHGVLELSCREIMPMLLLLDTWSITLNGVTHLREPLDSVLDVMHQEYLEHRDDGRRQKKAPVKWVGVSMAAAARWCVMRSRAYENSARSVKLVYDWYWHGARAVLHLKEKYPQALPCPLCVEADSQYHMLCGCQHPDIVDQRENGLLRLKALIGGYKLVTWQHRLLTVLLQMLQPSGFGSPECVWTGVFTSDHVEYMRGVTPVGAPYQHVAALLNTAGGIIIETARAIVRVRFTLIRRAGMMRRQFRRRASSYPAAVYRKGSGGVIQGDKIGVVAEQLVEKKRLVIQPTVISSLLGAYRGTGYRLTDGDRVEVARVGRASGGRYLATDYYGVSCELTVYQLCTLGVVGFGLDRRVVENICYLLNKDAEGKGVYWVAKVWVVDNESVNISACDHGELLSTGYLLIPVTDGVHWYGLILDVVHGHIFCLDSMGRRSMTQFDGVLRWIQLLMESEERRSYLTVERRNLVWRSPRDWTYSWIGLPRQEEPLDGGICMLHVMITIVRGQEIRYSKPELQLVREQLLSAVLRQELVLATGTVMLPYDPTFVYLSLGAMPGVTRRIQEDGCVGKTVVGEALSGTSVAGSEDMRVLSVSGDRVGRCGIMVGSRRAGTGTAMRESGCARARRLEKVTRSGVEGRKGRGGVDGLGMVNGIAVKRTNAQVVDEPSDVVDGTGVEMVTCRVAPGGTSRAKSTQRTSRMDCPGERRVGVRGTDLDNLEEVRGILVEYGIVWMDVGDLRAEYMAIPVERRLDVHEYNEVESVNKARHAGLFEPPWWLNESDINFYLGLWNRQSRMRYFCVRSEAVSGCFQGQYLRYDLVANDHVEMGIPFMSYSILHVPVNITQTHWVGATIYLEHRHIQYYDSFNIHRTEQILKVYIWFQLELEHHMRRGLVSAQRYAFLNDKDGWTYSYRRIPSQMNDYDCGLFVLLIILSHILGIEPRFHQRHLMLIREQFQVIFLRQVYPEFEPVDYKDIEAPTGRHISQLALPVYRVWSEPADGEEVRRSIDSSGKEVIHIDLTRGVEEGYSPEFWEHFPMRPD